MKNSPGLNTLFASDFYIDGRYAMSFAPMLSLFLSGKLSENLSGEELQQRIQNSMAEKDVSGSEKKVAVLSIKSPIVKYNYFGYLGTKTYQAILDQYKSDSSVAGVVLDMDTGGGQSYGTPEFYDYIRNYPKPIVTYTDGYLASAGYYIGNASDFIIANKRAEAIGSIGAYSSFIDLTGIIEKLGGKVHTFYADESPEKNYEHRKVMEGDYKPYIKNVLSPLVKGFQKDMKDARPNINEKSFKGGIFNAEKALEYNLIDQLGTLDTAILKVIELSNSNSNSNSNSMPKENSFPKLAAVLGIEEVEAKKAHIFSATETVSLSVAQLQSIENALSDPGDGQKLADLQTSLDAANAAKTKAEGERTALVNAVNTAVETAGLTAEKKPTAVENINLLSEKVAEFGSQPGAVPTKVTATADPSPAPVETTQIFDSIIK